jgi:hypothetical protein
VGRDYFPLGFVSYLLGRRRDDADGTADVDQMDRLSPVKLPLRIADNDPDGHVRIADADNRIVCRMVIPDGQRIAELIVSVIYSGRSWYANERAA